MGFNCHSCGQRKYEKPVICRSCGQVICRSCSIGKNCIDCYILIHQKNIVIDFIDVIWGEEPYGA